MEKQKRMVLLNKQSKKAKKAYFRMKRGDWNGMNPATRVMRSKKDYQRSQFKIGK